MANEQLSRASDWYETVRDYTLRLVRIRSVSPGEGENEVVREVVRLLREDGLADAYTASGLDPIEGDPYGRRNAYAFLRGQSTRTLVLLGHIDTVDTADYGPLEPWALDPEALATRQAALEELTPALADDLAAHPGDWLFGRGVIDMKSGVAANIAVLRQLARAGTPPPLSLILLATPDEENESAGILQAVRFLLRLREEHGLDYVGAINTDYTTARYPDDPHRYVYTGTIGKLLPSFLVVGRESHVGQPFDGLDANLLAAELMRALSMNADLCDVVRGQSAPPPVTLRATDLKAGYDVQLPFMAYFSLNVLTLTSGPRELLERLRAIAETVLERTLAHIGETERRWVRGSEDAAAGWRERTWTGAVLTYADLRATAVERLGAEAVAAALAEEEAQWPANLDKRERCLHLVRRLWVLSGSRGPAVIVYYSPPYYPHVAGTPCALHEAVAGVAAAHPAIGLVVREFFPYISDMSYLRLDAGADLTALTANMPIWREPGAPARAGSYTLPLEAISELGLPVVNLGPYGAGAHQRGERLLMSYSFGVLPQLIAETIEQLAAGE
ncbi:MAG: M20/M25/M40 family metallo-hydrolase [Ktedonobacterales bacterium]|nr:M20/M25/M40 family metallo-hydrolase [Ktedonobacterales bacterium]